MLYNDFKKKQNTAFSLIELLVVVSLFAIISTFVIMGFNSNTHEHKLFLTQWLEKIHHLSKEQNQSLPITLQPDGCLTFYNKKISNDSQSEFEQALANLNISHKWCNAKIINIFDLSKNEIIPAQTAFITIEPQNTLPAFEFKIQTDKGTYFLVSLNGFDLNIIKYIE